MYIENIEMKSRLVENMAENDISFKRYSAALDSLKENDGLIICLQLKNCQINDERLFELFSAMEHSETVTSIDLSDNLITDDGVLFLSKLLRGGGIQSLIYLDVRGNLITSRTYELLDEIQHVRKILKIYYDSDISSEGLSGLDEDVGTERAINFRSRWSAACTDNGDNWLLSKSRICDQSVFSLKDKVQSAVGVLKFKETLDTLRLAAMLKEISILVSNEVSLERQNDISRPARIQYSEGIKSLVDNFRFFISALDLNSSQGDIRGQGAGLHRIALAELLCVVNLHCGPLVEDDILSSGVLTKMLKLFCDFPQNSILHCAVFRCLQAILSGSSTTVFWHLLKDACLPSFLAREGTKCSALLQGRRPSYSGHIFVLSRTLKDLEENDERLKAFLMENMEWQSYVVQDGPFQKLQAEQSGDLCGPKPVLPRLVTNFLQNPTRNLVQVNQFTV
ncbi:uncharacterized protein LOC131034615 isoform X2 [Cryptomeria japonica]|uniref:uncharacterized protein LOC131034615 isoform X2 n=1 Tax=Cryptomeria japonica TaxID=3369 RepID=UPI0025AC2F2E|nr:uncharacterized protein LOC131034615 isoform X2 [Cryptomeria japonica]